MKGSTGIFFYGGKSDRMGKYSPADSFQTGLQSFFIC